MNASACIVAEHSRVSRLRSEPPIVLRTTPQGVYVVGGAGGPIGGDTLHLDIEVGDGANLVVRTAAAMIVLPGPHGEESSYTVTARVGSGSTLRWLPEPTVAAAGCRHASRVLIEASEDATIVWRDEVVLGRAGEPCGGFRTQMDVEIGGKALLRQRAAYGHGDGWNGPAVVGDARIVGSMLEIGGGAGTSRLPDAYSAAQQLSERAVLFTMVGDDAVAVRRSVTR